ncbi:MAG: flagellar biosynthetic protein FliO [Bacillus sp. (in: Bacteria)]|nr:flagellar biosynthetic protein FliO [Bacillus sp. (in: firmicutes)]
MLRLTTNVYDSFHGEQTPDSEESQDEIMSSLNDGRSTGVIIGQLFLYTLLILLLIYGLIKFLSLKQSKFQPNQVVKMLGGTSLGNNKSLQLIKVGGKVYLIGVADQVNLIKEVTDTEELHVIESDLEASKQLPFSEGMLDFYKSTVSQWLGAKGKNHDFKEMFQQSLRRQKEKQDELTGTLKQEQDKEEKLK